MPALLWQQNLRTALGKSRWDTLRRSVAKKSCAICGGAEQLEGHEVWEYQERPRVSVAKLLRVQTTCKKCHLLIHWFNTFRLVDAGKINQRAYG